MLIKQLDTAIVLVSTKDIVYGQSEVTNNKPTLILLGNSLYKARRSNPSHAKAIYTFAIIQK